MRTKFYQNSASIQKDIALSFDFSEYVVRHENIFKGLPRNPCIIVIDPKDRKLNKEKIALGKKSANGKGCYVAKKFGKIWTLNVLK